MLQACSSLTVHMLQAPKAHRSLRQESQAVLCGPQRPAMRTQRQLNPKKNCISAIQLGTTDQDMWQFKSVMRSAACLCLTSFFLLNPNSVVPKYSPGESGYTVFPLFVGPARDGASGNCSQQQRAGHQAHLCSTQPCSKPIKQQKGLHSPAKRV